MEKMLGLVGKVALMTGTSRCFGWAIVVQLGREAASVFVNYTGNAEAARETVADVVEAVEKLIAVLCVVGKVTEIVRLIDVAIGHFGRLDILVKIAGSLPNMLIAEMTEKEYDLLFEVNVKVVFVACRQAARRLADSGRDVNFSSSTTALMLPNCGAYVATKGSVKQMSRVLAKQLGPRGITVNVISPGSTDTILFGQGKSEQNKQRLAQLATLGRLGRPDEIAEVVVWLASDEARWVTGQNIRPNGGLI